MTRDEALDELLFMIERYNSLYNHWKTASAGSAEARSYAMQASAARVAMHRFAQRHNIEMPT